MAGRGLNFSLLIFAVTFLRGPLILRIFCFAKMAISKRVKKYSSRMAVRASHYSFSISRCSFYCGGRFVIVCRKQSHADIKINFMTRHQIKTQSKKANETCRLNFLSVIYEELSSQSFSPWD